MILKPRGEALHFSWGQWLALVFLILALNLGIQYVYAGRGALFQAEVLPEYLAVVPEFLLAWILGRIAGDDKGRDRYLIVLFSLGPPLIAVSALVYFLVPYLPDLGPWIEWSLSYWFLLWYSLAAGMAAIRLFDLRGMRALAVMLFVFVWLAATDSFLTSDRGLWAPAYFEEPIEREYSGLTEDAFYRQPQLLESALAALKPERPGHVDLYFIGAAGYASQGVFMREVNSVSGLFDERFDTAGRSIRFINNAATAAEVPIFSVTALERALTRIAGLMNRDEDMLFLFMTSHGSSEHRFSLDLGDMRFNEIAPAVLRKLLDDSGIKHRIIVVSACYSGGFVEALRDDNTLVITAAAADRNSFGCSNENDFTYFGKAYFDEALRKTWSFTEAFEMARPVIAARERAQEYTPSEPQIAVGKNIAPVLETFARQHAQTLR